MTKQADAIPDVGGGAAVRKPRLGFLGVGWIGRHRLAAVIGAGAAEVVAVADPSAEALEGVAALAPGARRVKSLEALLESTLDGLVIATPSAMHAEQAIAGLERGLAVFCQKPLGRTGAEAAAIVETARRRDRLLGLDLSYRATAAFSAVLETVRSGALGTVFAAEVVFHNACGPDKAWYRDAGQAGGGCVMDLGVHLLDLAMVGLGWPEVEGVEAELVTGGAAWGTPASRGTDGTRAARIEDYATATLRTANGAVVRMACSWNLHAGQDAVIEAAFYGTQGGVAMRNVGGSFFDLRAERFRGTARQCLVEPPDEWGGRAIVAWSRRLGRSPVFDPAADEFVTVAALMDRTYRAARRGEAE